MGFLSQPSTLISIRPVRKIGPITVNVVIQESTNDTLTITKQPVQQGASIGDHSYKEPTALAMTAYFQGNSIENLFTSASAIVNSVINPANALAKIYTDLQNLQNSRIPFDVITPKRIYKNMLMSTLSQTTDKLTENVLKVDFTFQEIIIVKVSTTSVPRTAQKNPGATGKTENAGKKSGLFTLFGPQTPVGAGTVLR